MNSFGCLQPDLRVLALRLPTVKGKRSLLKVRAVARRAQRKRQRLLLRGCVGQAYRLALESSRQKDRTEREQGQPSRAGFIFFNKSALAGD